MDMRLNILICGKAGQGFNEMAAIISRAIANSGIYVFNYREYGSWIIGGPNFNVLCISDKKTGSFDYSYDIALVLDEEILKLHQEYIKKDAIILSEKNVKVENKKIENMYFAGALFKVLGLDKKYLLAEVEKKFKGKSLYEEDVKVISSAYEKNYPKHLSLKAGKTKKILNGSEAIAHSALSSGLDVYFGYPMTPSTGVLTLLAQAQKNPENKHFVFEPENEIAIANAALGSSFAGALAMIGTSGGGFDLMTEAFAMQGLIEIPLVAHLSQRGSSSTGIPTYTGQTNINVALYGGNGEAARVVIAPGDAKEAWEKTREAFYFSEKYGILSIILSDKHLVESDFSFDEFEESKLKIPERKILTGKKIFRVNSYEHDGTGHVTENAEKIKKSTEKRIKKIGEIEKESKKFETYKEYGKGENLIISFGSNKGAILDALESLENFKFIHLIYLEPFPDIEKELEKAKKVFVLECNATGQLCELIRKKTGFKVEDKNKILKYDGRPFTPKEILEEI